MNNNAVLNFATDKKLGFPCFRSLLTLVSRLTDDDMEKLTLTYLNQDTLLVKQITIDLLGAMATNRSWSMLVEYVIMSSVPHPELVSRAITSFVEEGKRHPKVNI